MVNKGRLLPAIAVFMVMVLVVLGLYSMSKYERVRRAGRQKEHIDRFDELARELPDLDKVRRIPLLFAERLQPLDTVARRKLRELSGSRSPFNQDPVLVFLSLCFDHEAFGWKQIPLFRVEHQRNKELFGLDGIDTMATYEQISSEKARVAFVEANLGAEGESNSGIQSMSLADRELWMLQERRLAEFDTAYATMFLVVPPRPGQSASTTRISDWHPPTANTLASWGYDKKLAKEIETSFIAIGDAWRNRDNKALDAATDRLLAACKPIRPDLYPSDEDIDTEMSFNNWNPIVNASWAYLLSSVLMLFAGAFSIRPLRWTSFACAAIGLVMHGYGLYIRTTLGFGVTITNLYESMIAMGAACVLICVIIDLVRGSFWSTMAGGLAGFFVIQMVDLYSVKFDDAIGGVIAVLSNNIWVHIHVPVVMSAYAAYFISFILSTMGMFMAIASRGQKTPELMSLMKPSAIAVDIGTVLIFAGLILGGIWADVSWGRFWGWDPKETWALILFLWYVGVIVHGRLTKALNMDPFFMNWLTFLGGGFLLWTYYGTNELLSGLHSYANSSDGTGFWDNFIHERNRWFIWANITLLAVWFGALGCHLFLRGRSNSGSQAGGGDQEPATPAED